jgi:hypothetical protein
MKKTPTRPEQPQSNYRSLGDPNASRGQRLESATHKGKLELDQEYQVRKQQQLQQEQERLRQDNELKKQRTEAENTRFAAAKAAQGQSMMEQEKERQLLVQKRQDDRQAELAASGKVKQMALDDAERLRKQNKLDNDAKIIGRRI